jgi:hypothetical protein
MGIRAPALSLGRMIFPSCVPLVQLRQHYFGCACALVRLGACSMRASISASLMPLFAKSDLSPSSDKKFEVRMNGEPVVFIRKKKNCSGSLPLTLATPHFLFYILK